MVKIIALDKNTDYEQIFKQIKMYHKKLGVFHSATQEDLTAFFKVVNASQNIIVGVKINRVSNCIEVFSKNKALQNEFDEVIKSFAKKIKLLLDISKKSTAKQAKANRKSFFSKTPTAKPKKSTVKVKKEAPPKRKSTTTKSNINPMNYYTKVLQNYAVFSGRARRSEYWYFVLFSFIISFVLGFFGLYNVSRLYSLAVLVPSIAVGVRRMHDVGKSGWFLLIPIYNLILACTDGVVEENEYGPNPKEVENDGGNVTATSTPEGNEFRTTKPGVSPVNDGTSIKSSPAVTSGKLQKLKEVKDLLDSGVITQSEFDNLKAEILNETAESPPPVRETSKVESKITAEPKHTEKVVEPFAVVTLVTSIVGFFIYPAVFYLICFISSFISYYRIKGDIKYNGTAIRIVGYVILIAGVWYTSYLWGCKWYQIFTCFYFGDCY